MYAQEDGEYLVMLARKVIEDYLRKGKTQIPVKPPGRLVEKAGVFVTLETYPKKSLRGCIGYPEPVMPLIEALPRAAISAATGDPRFPPIEEEELERLIVEVSILTKPELLEVPHKEYVKKIDLGRHGLIAEKGFSRGLLLPQVAVAQEWNKEEFLSHTCIKAGLLPDAWWDEDTRVYRFEGVVFAELAPKGRVVLREMNKY